MSDFKTMAAQLARLPRSQVASAQLHLAIRGYGWPTSNESNIRHRKHYIQVTRSLGIRSKVSSPCVRRTGYRLLRDIFADVCSDAHATLVQMDGKDVQYPPKVAVSSLVNSLKGVSSRLLRQQRPDIRKRYWKGVLWPPSVILPRPKGRGLPHVLVSALD